MEVDPEVSGERPGGRQRAALDQHALGDRLHDLIPKLLVDRHLTGQVDVEDHCSHLSRLLLYKL